MAAPTFAVSGTGTSGMETVVANLVREGSRVLERTAAGAYAGRPS